MILCHFKIRENGPMPLLGPGTHLGWSTQIVSCSHACFLHFVFYKMKKYCVVLNLFYFKICENGLLSFFGPFW